MSRVWVIAIGLAVVPALLLSFVVALPATPEPRASYEPAAFCFDQGNSVYSAPCRVREDIFRRA